MPRVLTGCPLMPWPQAKQQAEEAGVSPEQVAASQNTVGNPGRSRCATLDRGCGGPAGDRRRLADQHVCSRRGVWGGQGSAADNISYAKKVRCSTRMSCLSSGSTCPWNIMPSPLVS
jgi:hypothetical protein